MKLYVGNLPYNISDDQLQAMFEKFGTPGSARVITDRTTGQSKGFGFVEFENDEQARQALSLNGTDFGGRALTVNEARPRAEAGGGAGATLRILGFLRSGFVRTDLAKGERSRTPRL